VKISQEDAILIKNL